MAIEVRGKNQHVFVKWREGRRVRSCYMKDPYVAGHYRQYAYIRAKEAPKRAAEQLSLDSELMERRVALADLRATADDLITASLLAAGFRWRGGRWRLARRGRPRLSPTTVS